MERGKSSLNNEKIKGKDVDKRKSNDDFVRNYPLIDACIADIYPHGNLTNEGIRMLRDLMISGLQKKDMDDMEDDWFEYHLQEIELQNKRMELMKKQANLIDKATHAYKSNK
ncbi:hypothetical protein Lser_V15G04714 [Lactuca serriola]